MANDATLSLPGNGTAPEAPSEDYSEVLTQYNAEFIHRYTELDPNFETYLKEEGDPPPIIEDFNCRPAYRDDNRGNHNRGFKRRYDDRQRQDSHPRQDSYRQRPDHRSHDRPPYDQRSYGGDKRPQYNRPWQDSRPGQGSNQQWQDNRSHDRYQGGQNHRRDRYSDHRGQKDRHHQQGGGRHPHNEWT